MYEQAAVAEENTYFVNDDIEVLIYMDKKNNIKQIQTEEDIKLTEVEYGISATLILTGEDNAIDEMSGKFNFAIAT